MVAINTINPMNPQPNSRNPCNGSWHPSPPTNSSFLVFLNIELQSSALRSDQAPTKPYHGYCQAYWQVPPIGRCRTTPTSATQPSPQWQPRTNFASTNNSNTPN